MSHWTAKYGGGTTGGKTAQQVAKAFYAGRSCTRGNAKTDGRTYWLYGNAIARRVPDDEILKVVADAVVRGIPAPRRLEFSFAGFRTTTTVRHLDALGVVGCWHGSESKRNPRPPEMCGKPVDPNGWYTLEQLALMPKWQEPPKRPRAERFENRTLELFA